MYRIILSVESYSELKYNIISILIFVSINQYLENYVNNCVRMLLFNKYSHLSLDSFGNCWRPVFSLGVSQQICEIFCSFGHRRDMENKKNIHVLSDAWKSLQLKSFNKWVRSCLFPENYIALEGAISHNVSYYQKLSIARYQVSFYILCLLLVITRGCVPIWIIIAGLNHQGVHRYRETIHLN